MIQKNMDGNSFLVDTNIIIDYDKGKDPLLKKYFQTKKILVVSTITVFEYYSAKQLENKDFSEKADLLFSFFKIQEVNSEIAKVAAYLNRRYNLYKKIGVGDIIIAATSFYLEAPLLTKNQKHFKLIPNLKFAPLKV